MQDVVNKQESMEGRPYLDRPLQFIFQPAHPAIWIPALPPSSQPWLLRSVNPRPLARHHARTPFDCTDGTPPHPQARLRRLLCHDLPQWRECARRRRVHRRMWTATRMMTRTEKTTTMKMTHRSQAGSARRPLRRQLVRTRRLLANASWMGSDVTPLDSLEAQEVVAQAFRFHSVLIYAHPHSSVLANAHAYFSCRTHTHVHSVRQRIPGRGSRR